jgi:glutaredoxin 3
MNVKVYSTPTCPWCKHAKDYLKRNNIQFDEINVQGNKEAAQEMIKKSSQMGVPVIDIDGKIIVGFDEQELDKVLKGGQK